jgi:hypothetical protein
MPIDTWRKEECPFRLSAFERNDIEDPLGGGEIPIIAGDTLAVRGNGRPPR